MIESLVKKNQPTNTGRTRFIRSEQAIPTCLQFIILLLFLLYLLVRLICHFVVARGRGGDRGADLAAT